MTLIHYFLSSVIEVNCFNFPLHTEEYTTLLILVNTEVWSFVQWVDRIAQAIEWLKQVSDLFSDDMIGWTTEFVPLLSTEV